MVDAEEEVAAAIQGRQVQLVVDWYSAVMAEFREMVPLQLHLLLVYHAADLTLPVSPRNL